jgi:hypothetical protein
MYDFCCYCTLRGNLSACEDLEDCPVHQTWHAKASEEERMKATAGFIGIIDALQNEIDRLKNNAPKADFKNVLLNDRHRVWQMVCYYSRLGMECRREQRPWNLRTIALGCGLSRERARAALNALVSDGLVHESPEGFIASDGSAAASGDWHEACTVDRSERKDCNDPDTEKNTTAEG